MSLKRQTSVTEQICAALLELMGESPYMEITVTDVVKKAGVARASFYRNYNSTNDVLDEIIQKVVNELSIEIIPALTSEDERQIRDFLFQTIYRLSTNSNRQLFKNPINGTLVASKLNSQILLLEKNLSPLVKRKYTLAAKAGAISSVIKVWMDSGMEESPEEIVNTLMKFMM